VSNLQRKLEILGIAQREAARAVSPIRGKV